MKNYLHALKPPPRTQRQRLTPDQARNNAGGFTFKVSDEGRFLRFLILGATEGTYYATEAAHTVQATDFVRGYVARNGPAALRLILEVTRGHRAPRPDATLMALALVARTADLETRRSAWAALPEVARTGTMLLHFLAYQDALGGWGRLTRRGVARVYEDLPLGTLALWAVKYRSRDGWAQADALRLAHPRSTEPVRHAVFRHMLGQPSSERPPVGQLLPELESPAPALRLIEGHQRAMSVTTDVDAAALMREYGLPIEAVSTGVRGADVYRAALETNGLTWLLRNLGNLSRLGLLAAQHPEIVSAVVTRLSNASALRRGRVHPLDVLKAQLVYAQGRGVRGSHVWTPAPAVIDALEQAFYLAFGLVKPSGGRFLLALDVSGSMDIGTVGGVPGLSPRLATAAMGLVTARSEVHTTPVAFTSGVGGMGGQWGGTSGLTPLNISPRQRLDDVVKAMRALPMGGTDCALPMLWAAKEKIPVDTFVVYTDNETWAGKVHPSVALAEYRQRMGTPARLVVVGMTATAFSVADPADSGMLDVVGFDAAAPNLIGAFARGEV
ncbi:TROVE domain-containing protein [Deinococcus altitudinis]|uniref:TROVE domain-containing protein n=1 Tax=Deinococcus altitudinis TaxID=468914 RepID=UPI003892B3BF